MTDKISDSSLNIYAEGRTRKIFVGQLKWNRATDTFEFKYDRKYLKMSSAIAVGPELPLSIKTHSAKGKLFPSFQDRIPSRGNPAYEEYCESAGISPREKNPIILLGAIGKRGPSAFVFEPILTSVFDAQSELGLFRKRHQISLQECALALDLNAVTLQRIETGKSKDPHTSRLLELFFTVPQALRFQLKKTAGKIHRRTETKLIEYSRMIRTASESERSSVDKGDTVKRKKLPIDV